MRIKHTLPLAAGMALATAFTAGTARPRYHAPETAGHLKGNCTEVSDSRSVAPGQYYPAGNGYVFNQGGTQVILSADVVNHTGSRLIQIYDRASGISTALVNNSCYRLHTPGGGMGVAFRKGKVLIDDMNKILIDDMRFAP
jgi:hypothetical protein